MTVDGYLNRVKDKIVGVPYNMFIWRTENLGRVDVKAWMPPCGLSGIWCLLAS